MIEEKENRCVPDNGAGTRMLPIAYGNSCSAKFWSNKTVRWEELCERLKTTMRTTETAEEYKRMSRADREAAKDKGGFVGGHLRDNRRKAETVACRSMLTLDADNAEPGFIEKFTENCRHAACLYTTHGHTPEAPRCRIIVPLTRDVTPDEYTALTRFFADEWGIDQFDECSYKPNQLMYWPTTPANGEFICRVTESGWLDPDERLAAHPGWRDCSLLPTSSRESALRDTTVKKQKDPLEKDGIVGAFCRTYSISKAIGAFLSDVYTASDAVEGRYDYIPGEGTAGVVIYDDKFAYSHHSTDPACGRLLNAFDLVRVHKFNDVDEKQSFFEMQQFASEDTDVGNLLLKERNAEAGSDFTVMPDAEWMKKLKRISRSTELANSISNLCLILQNDDYMKSIVFNQLADGMEIKGDVPWKHPARFWRDQDDAQLVTYIDNKYGTFSARNYQISVTKVTDDRSYHPIRDYFSSLPEWDGVPRVDTALIDYLGAEDNAYVRAITRKTLCAAYMRVHKPGIKFDYMPVLNGEQGIGKSTFISKLGMEWYSDSLNLSDMNDKTAAEKLQGYWILEIGELAGMKKADLDKVKAFISRQDDKYRASFGRRVSPHPRQSVFIATTNSEHGYLRDITGNRRYWNVSLTGRGKYKPWQLTQDTVDRLWAEVAVLAKAGEPLYLPADLEAYAKEEQRKAMEQDDREGLVREYLDMLLPANWDAMDAYDRKRYVRELSDPTRPKGVRRRNEVSNIEIWCECFGNNPESMKPADSYSIAAIMIHIGGWKKPEGRKRIPVYGQQRIYKREPMCDNPA